MNFVKVSCWFFFSFNDQKQLIIYVFQAFLKTIRVKNKGAFTAKLVFVYYKTNYGPSLIERVNLLSLQQYTFKYPGGSIAGLLFTSAIGYNGLFSIDLIRNDQVCIDIYGIITLPKYTRIKC